MNKYYDTKLAEPAGIDKLIIGVIVSALLLILVNFAFIKSGLTVKLMTNMGNYKAAIRISEKHNLNMNDWISERFDEKLNKTAEKFIDEKISENKARKILVYYTDIKDNGYTGKGSADAEKLAKLCASRGCLTLGNKLAKLECSGENTAAAIEAYAEIIPEDTKYYPMKEELQDKAMQNFEARISTKIESADYITVLNEVESFKNGCTEEAFLIRCDAAVADSKNEMLSALSRKVRSLAESGNYQSGLDFLAIYKADISAIPELDSLRMECETKLIEDKASKEIFAGSEGAFALASEFAKDYPSAGMTEKAGKCFKEKIDKMLDRGEYGQTISYLGDNKILVDEYSDNIGFTANVMILSIYKQWYAEQRNSGNYLTGDNGAISLANEINKLDAGFVDIDSLADEAAEYEKNNFLTIVNSSRSKYGKNQLKADKALCSACAELAEEIEAGKKISKSMVTNVMKAYSIPENSETIYWCDDGVRTAEEMFSLIKSEELSGKSGHGNKFSKLGISFIYHQPTNLFISVAILYN